MHARYYRPLVGRFLSVDQGGHDPKRPLRWNRYSYVSGNPLSKVDPDGNDEFLLVWKSSPDNVGHAAVAVQNRDSSGKPNGTVTVRHLWPANPVGKSLQAPADYRRETISEKSLGNFRGGEEKGADGVVRIKGNAAQDAAVSRALDRADTNRTYTAPTNTCSTYAAAGIEATGIDVDQRGMASYNVGPLQLKKMEGIVTPLAVYNSVVDSGDPRVQVVTPIAQSDRNPNLVIKP